MKKTFIFFALISTAILFNGCSADQLIGSMSAMIGGESWTASAPGGTIQNNRIVVTGVGSNKNISITVNSATVGTYNIDVLNQTNFVTYTPNVNAPQSSYAAVSGSITVTSVGNNRITGNFSVIVSDGSTSIPITNGSFNNIIYL